MSVRAEARRKARQRFERPESEDPDESEQTAALALAWAMSWAVEDPEALDLATAALDYLYENAGSAGYARHISAWGGLAS
jgi:hypothetical protein